MPGCTDQNPMPPLPEILARMGLILGLGLLIGLQRERTDARLAGIRTFPLVGLLGWLSGLLAERHGPWMAVPGLVGLALVIVGGNLPRIRGPGDPEHPGITSEVAMLVMYAAGVYSVRGEPVVVTVTGGVVAVLLHLKPEMHSLAARMGEQDFRAVMQFALISLVILPVLPDRYFGPYQVLNPFRLWLMVVLIVGIGLVGYVAHALVGRRGGALAGGIAGGLVSSTATTVAAARRSRGEGEAGALGALMVLAASAVVFLRILVLLAATSRPLLQASAGPMVVMFAVLGVAGWITFRTVADDPVAPLPHENPSELKPAILFGLVFAAVLLATAAAREFLGTGGVFLVGILAGTTDLDAMTLSVAQMVESGQLGVKSGWKVLMAASMSNLVFKAGIVMAVGDRRLGWKVGPWMAAGVAVGGGLLMLWR